MPSKKTTPVRRSRIINLQYLINHGACREKQRLFMKIFGNKDVPVTLTLARRYRKRLSVYWLCGRLSPEQYGAFCKECNKLHMKLVDRFISQKRRTQGWKRFDVVEDMLVVKYWITDPNPQ